MSQARGATDVDQRLSVPTFDTLPEYVDHWARQTPDAEAYVDGDDRATYRQLAERVGAFAAALHARGIGPGHRVAILTEPRAEYWICLLGTLQAGATWLGLNPKYQLEELRHVIGDSRPSLILGAPRSGDRDLRAILRQLVEHAGTTTPILLDTEGPEGWSAFLAGAPPAADGGSVEGPDPDSAALIVYTSGSTGKPKGAVLGHRGLCSSFRIQGEHNDLTGMRVIVNLPINHIGGVGDLCCTPLVQGGALIFQPHFSPDAIFDAIEHEGANTLMQVPAMLKILTEHPRWDTADLTGLQFVAWGGGPLPADTVAALRATRARLVTTYGMTEITGSISYSLPDASDEELSTTVGRPIDEIELRLIGRDDAPVAPGEEGEVAVRHPGLFLGYFDNPEATRAAYTADGYFRTGDVAVLRPDGTLRLVGRRKEMYKSGGYNVYPRETELALESHPAVSMAAVVSVEHETFGEVGVAFCEIAPGCTVTGDELDDWCRQRLANYKIPKQFRLVDALPLLPVGKVDKMRLRAGAQEPG